MHRGDTAHEAYGVPAQRRNIGHQQEDIDRNEDRAKAVPLDPDQIICAMKTSGTFARSAHCQTRSSSGC